MTNIVVKDASNNDVTYEVVNRAGPDGTFAIWTDTTNPVPLFRPTFKVSTKANGPGTTDQCSYYPLVALCCVVT